MPLTPATDADLSAIATLVNAAYRGPEAAKGWTSEAGMIGGERTNVEQLREETARPGANLLILRDDDAEHTLLGCVTVEHTQGSIWYLGMLTVRPDLQSKGTGRVLLTGAEDYARDRGAREMHMTVVSIRSALIAWYERRGYRDTGERLPYPYGDPPRTDLRFAVLTKEL